MELRNNERTFGIWVSLAARSRPFVTPPLSQPNGERARSGGQPDLTLRVALATLAPNGSPERLDADRRRPGLIQCGRVLGHPIHATAGYLGHRPAKA